MAGQKMMKYLFYFAHDHLDFRYAELRSILDYFKIKACVPELSKCSPFLTVELSNEEDGKKIASRSILIRSVFECWLSAESLDKLYTGLEQLPPEFLNPYLKSKDSFAYRVSSFNKKLKSPQILQIIEGLPLQFEGPVDLKNSKETYHVLLDYGGPDGKTLEQPTRVYFGRWIADGQRDKIQEYHLKKRKFIANTSMDAQLSMIIANIGKVGPNMWVHDPFVGSGGLLVAAGHFGAHVSGTDIDYLLLHAKAAPSRVNQTQREEDESIRANLRQYGYEHLYLDVMVADASSQGLWREQPLFDTIITDPPYGIREGAKRQEGGDAMQNRQANTISRKEDYHLTDMFKDLLNFAAKYLHQHGRLVYWFPVMRKDYTEENLPTHPCFKLVYNCEQILNLKASRRLITMEKVHELDNCDTEAEVKVDHFGNETFRQRYFTVDKTGVKPSIETDHQCDTISEPDNLLGSVAGHLNECSQSLTSSVKNVQANDT